MPKLATCPLTRGLLSIRKHGFRVDQEYQKPNFFEKRSTFHENNLASADPWCYTTLFPLYGQVDPRSVENVYQLQKNLLEVLVCPEAGGKKFVLYYL